MFFYTFFLIFSCALCAAPFQEIWAYLMEKEEQKLKGDEPITDLAYFCARLTETGHLDHIPKRTALPGVSCRIHLVIADLHNRSLLYWVLVKDPVARKELIQEIVQSAIPFDGINIDFEGIRPQDRDGFLLFLRELRTQLPKSKLLSVAVMPRTGPKEDAFDYPQIASIVDRVFVMAYDEHWSTSPPGEIASLAWCQKVSRYAKKTIPSHKLIMGLPLYGRVWQTETVATALTYPKALELLKNVAATVMRTTGGTGYFSFEKNVHATAYFEDMQSLGQKLNAYSQEGVQSIGFWRVGQGPAELWSYLDRGTKIK
jgi:spore germination protein